MSKQEKSSNVSIQNVMHVETDSNGTAEDAGTAGQYIEIAEAVQQQLDRRNEALLKQIREQSEQSIQDAVKRALERQSKEKGKNKKQRKDPELKAKGNKIRYEVNEQIIEKIEMGIEAMDSKEIEEAKAEFNAGKDILLQQQKLIRLADREELGWEVIKHYVDDDLADGSDDEKAIKKARKEALESITKRKEKRREQFRNASLQKAQRYKQGDTGRRDWSARGTGSGSSGWRPQSRTYDRTRSTICYKCEREGHLQTFCPYRYTR